MKKSTIGTVLTAMTVVTVSVAAWAASGYPSGTPTKVWAGFTDDSVYVVGLPNTASCSSSTIQFATAQTDTGSIERLATAALLSGKSLECYVNGCSGSYQKGYDCKLQN